MKSILKGTICGILIATALGFAINAGSPVDSTGSAAAPELDDGLSYEGLEDLVDIAHLVAIGNLTVEDQPESSRTVGDGPYGGKPKVWLSLELTESPLHVNHYALRNSGVAVPQEGEAIDVGLSLPAYELLKRSDYVTDSSVPVVLFAQHFETDTHSGFGPSGGVLTGLFVLDEEHTGAIDRNVVRDANNWPSQVTNTATIRTAVAPISRDVQAALTDANARLDLLNSKISDFVPSEKDVPISLLNQPTASAPAAVVALNGLDQNIGAFGIVCSVDVGLGESMQPTFCDKGSATSFRQVDADTKVGIFESPDSLLLAGRQEPCAVDKCRLVIVTSTMELIGSIPIQPPLEPPSEQPKPPLLPTEIPNRASGLDVEVSFGDKSSEALLIHLKEKPQPGRYGLAKCERDATEPTDCMLVDLFRPTSGKGMHVLVLPTCVDGMCEIVAFDLRDISRRSIIELS